MQILFIIIVVVIVSIVSAVSKKKPNRSSEEEPPRPTMSDIQKAFMLANDFDVRQRNAEQAAQRFEESISAESKYPQGTETSYSSDPVSSPYADVTISQYHMDEPQHSVDDKPLVSSQTGGSLKLFEEKDAFVRAVIYSEILTRRGGRRHS